MTVVTSRSICACLATLAAGVALAADLDDELAAALAVQATASQSQARIDALDEQTRRLRAERLNLADAEVAWRVATDALMLRLRAQDEQIAALAAKTADAQRTAEQILPLMAAMVDTLERFVTLDLPFDTQARLAAVRALRDTLVRPDLGTAEKFVRVMDVYQRELDFGYDIQASRGRAPGHGRFVDLLRLGRTAYYYRSLDGVDAGVWDRRRQSWISLDGSHADRIGQALAVVRGESTPGFLTLPVVLPDTPP